MSVPLRKDEFDDQELTTADLAQGKRPAPVEDRSREDQTNKNQPKQDSPNDARFGLSDNRPGPVLAQRQANENANTATNAVAESRVASETKAGSNVRNMAGEATPLFPPNELDELRNRWSDVQTAFVDEPRRAVEQADGLVASAMKRLAEVFAEERSKLEGQWDRGDNVSTEDLRIALQRYRTFFQRLLSI